MSVYYLDFIALLGRDGSPSYPGNLNLSETNYWPAFSVGWIDSFPLDPFTLDITILLLHDDSAEVGEAEWNPVNASTWSLELRYLTDVSNFDENVRVQPLSQSTNSTTLPWQPATANLPAGGNTLHFVLTPNPGNFLNNVSRAYGAMLLTHLGTGTNVANGEQFSLPYTWCTIGNPQPTTYTQPIPEVVFDPRLGMLPLDALRYVNTTTTGYFRRTTSLPAPSVISAVLAEPALGVITPFLPLPLSVTTTSTGRLQKLVNLKPALPIARTNISGTLSTAERSLTSLINATVESSPTLTMTMNLQGEALNCSSIATVNLYTDGTIDIKQAASTTILTSGNLSLEPRLESSITVSAVVVLDRIWEPAINANTLIIPIDSLSHLANGPVYDTDTDDIRKIMFALCEAMYTSYRDKPLSDRPLRMNLNRTGLDFSNFSDSSIKRSYTFAFVVDSKEEEVAPETL